MFVGITNTPRPYAWGSLTALAELSGRVPSGGPEGELWLGAHAGSPSVIIDPTQTGGAADLASWIAADPHTALGPFAHTETPPRLPFLLKILAAASPLSLQAHPTLDQAREGFRRENAAGIPLDAPQRNYKDPFAKPELVYALSPVFEALCGFRPIAEVRSIVEVLLDIDAQGAEPQPQPLENLLERLLVQSGDPLREVFAWLSSRGSGVATLVDRVSELAGLYTADVHGPAGDQAAALAAPLVTAPATALAAALGTAHALALGYPDDPGIVISLLLNRVTLKQGEALYLPAGNIHAYLNGLAVELMSASDNVLRGGLTPKHIDVAELLSVLNFNPAPVPYLRAEHPAPGIEVFRPDSPDFMLIRIHLGGEMRQSALPEHPEAPIARLHELDELDEPGSASYERGSASYELAGPGIAICTAGSVEITGAASSVSLERGQSVYITPDEATLAFSGSGEVFLATVGQVASTSVNP